MVKSLALFQGRVHAGTSEGIAVEAGDDRWDIVRRAGPLEMRNVVLAAAPDGKALWAAAAHLKGGLVRFDGTAWKFMGGEGRGLFNDVSCFAFLDGDTILGTSFGAVYRWTGTGVGAWQEGLPAANIIALAERGGAVYAGTSRGLYVFRGDRWASAQVPGGFEGVPVFAMARSEADLFVGGLKGLYLLDRRGQVRAISGTDGFPSGPVTALAESGGRIFAATEHGVAVVTGWAE